MPISWTNATEPCRVLRSGKQLAEMSFVASQVEHSAAGFAIYDELSHVNCVRILLL
jgi:hypothetical protein